MFSFSTLAVAASVAAVATANHHGHGHDLLGRSHHVERAGHHQKRDFTGQATYYAVGLGACGQNSVSTDFIVALNSAQYGGGYPGPHCFQSVHICRTGTSKCSNAVIMDECPTCDYGSLDMSESLFKSMGTLDEGVFPITWNFGSGGSSDPEPTTTSKKPTPTTTYKPEPTTTYKPEPTTTWEPPTTTSTKKRTTTSSPPPETTSTPEPTTTSHHTSTTSSTPTTTSTTEVTTSTSSSSSSTYISTTSVAATASASTSAAAATTSGSGSNSGSSSGSGSSGSNLADMHQAFLHLGQVIVVANGS